MLIKGNSGPDFMMEFHNSRSRVPKKDTDGKEVWHLWRIWNKCTIDTVDGDLCYEVQYWENYKGTNLVHARPAEEIRSSYPDAANAWDAKYGQAWDVRYGNRGNIWSADDEPALMKRAFNDTPQKARKEDAKKPRVFVREVVPDSDEDMGDLPDPFRGTPASQKMAPPRKPRLNQFQMRIPAFRPSSNPAESSEAAIGEEEASNSLAPAIRLGFDASPDRARIMMNSSRRRPAVGSGGGISGRIQVTVESQTDSDGHESLQSPSRQYPSITGGSSEESSPIKARVGQRIKVEKSPDNALTTSRQGQVSDHESVGSLTPRRRLFRSSHDISAESMQDLDMDNLQGLTSQLTVRLSRHPAGSESSVPNVRGDAGQSGDGILMAIEDSQQSLGRYGQAGHSGDLSQASIDDTNSGQNSRGLIVGPSVSDGLMAVYEESQRELLDEDEADLDLTQKVIDENQFEEYSQLLISAHATGIECLVRTALDLTDLPCDNWVTKRKASSKCDYGDFISYLVVMMLGMDEQILEHFVKGDLSEAEKGNPDLRKSLRKLKSLGPKERCPSIYAQYLVDKDGKSPTPRILTEVLDHAELYLKGLNRVDQQSGDFAAQVDSVKGKPRAPSNAVAGERKYVKGETQSDTCLAWIQNTRARISSLLPDVPLDRPLAEVGYATVPIERLEQQHAKHTSSNYLMNLCEAICEVLYGQRYSIAQYIVFHTFHLAHAMYAEIILSRIGLVYSTQGGGFSHFRAGVSHPGADEVPKDFYDRKEARLFEDPSFEQRVTLELSRKAALAELYEGMISGAEGQDRMLDEMNVLTRAPELCQDMMAQQKKEMEELLDSTDPYMKLLELAEDVDID